MAMTGAVEGEVLDAPVEVADDGLAASSPATLERDASELVDPLGTGGGGGEVEPQVVRRRPERIVG